MTKIHELGDLGQSVWLEYVRRNTLTTGVLDRLVEKGLGGVVADPVVFRTAVSGGMDYDEALVRWRAGGRTPAEIVHAMVVEDGLRAADLLLPVFERTAGRDGHVVLHVDPSLNADEDAMVETGKALFMEVGRPNVMVSVPATTSGIRALASLTSAGVNTCAGYMATLQQYRQVTAAYLEGVQRLSEQGPSVQGGLSADRVASVAGFLVNSLDFEVNRELSRIGREDLAFRAGLANAKMAYMEQERMFSGDNLEVLAQAGARVQRLMWRGTAARRPTISDNYYAEGLIGPDTICLMLPETLNHFQGRGAVANTLEQGREEAERSLDELRSLGVDIDRIGTRLAQNVLAETEAEWSKLKEAVMRKTEQIAMGRRRYSASLGEYGNAVAQALDDIRERKVVERIWNHDHTLYSDSPDEIANRLGWLYCPEKMTPLVAEISDFVEEVRTEGYTSALLLGMGGSSLAPELFSMVFGNTRGYLDLDVLDSTDPGAVAAALERNPPEKTLYIVSTKSGGTVETLSFFKYCYNQVVDAVGRDRAGRHFAAITDPGSSLGKLGAEYGFRKVFLNDPDIGGRYSVLSFFGLVPAALVGADIGVLLERAESMGCNAGAGNCPVRGDNTSAWLGVTMGELAKGGADKLTLVASPTISPFGAWAEQLVAESTGKNGAGILPVDGEPLLPPDRYFRDRLFVYLRMKGEGGRDQDVEALEDAGFPVVRLFLEDAYDLGAEFFRWEMATAVASERLGVNPFDQPNVEAAKKVAKAMVANYLENGKLPAEEPAFTEDGVQVHTTEGGADLAGAFAAFLGAMSPGDDNGRGRSYLAIQAYVTPSPEMDGALAVLRKTVLEKYSIATTVGYGPRYLHSTGQLHKGDAGNGLFLQLVSDADKDLPIPDKPGEPASGMSFGVLKKAQAMGDRRALTDAGRKVFAVHCGPDPKTVLDRLAKAL
ncbi:MAG: bifunctional transaldolase/phosoglucose isomerase [Desulfatibacillaceae bacterium]